MHLFQDACAHAVPLGLQGCIVEWEGKKKGKYTVFSVVDRTGLSLMRMSTSDGNEAIAWVQVCSCLQTRHYVIWAQTRC